MALEYVLFPMMGCLSKAECAFVRKWVAGEQLRLFDCARGKKRSDLAAIRKEFASMTDAEFATLRCNLQDSVAEAIGEYHSQKRPTYIVFLQIGAAESFMNKSQPEDALRTLKKAIKLGYAYEEHTFLHQMGGLLERLPEFLFGNKQAQSRLLEIDELLQQLAEQHRQILLRLDWLHIALKLKQGGLEGLRNKAAALLAQLPAFEKEIKSKANLLLARLYWLCLDFIGDFFGCVPYLDWAIDLARRTPWLWHDSDAYAAIEGAYFKRSSLYAAALDHDASLKLIESYGSNCVTFQKGATQRMQDKIRLIQLRKLLHLGHRDEILSGLRLLHKEVGVVTTVSNDQFSLYLWVLNYCLETRNFQEAVPWLTLLKTTRIKLVRTPMVVVSFLMELAICFTSGDVDELESAIRRMLYYERERGGDHEFVSIIAKGFRGIANTKPGDHRALQRFIDALASIAQSESATRYFEIFDLIQYLNLQSKGKN